MKFELVTVIVIIAISCKHQNTGLYEFDPRSLDENKITLAEIADDITYISLDNSYPLSLIYKYYFINNSIYLSAKDVGILRSDRDGRISKKIGAIGRGPGEYLYPMKFVVDYNQETVYVNDIGNKLYAYSKNGNFLRTISFNEYSGNIDQIHFYNSKLFLFNFLQFGDTKYNWIVIDTLGYTTRVKERTIPLFWSNWGARSGTYIFNSNLSYWNPYLDTVYSILPDLSIKASFLLAAGEHRLPKSAFNPEHDLPHLMQLRFMFETNRFIVISYFFNKEQSLALIEKKSGKSFLSCWEAEDNVGIVNDLDGGSLFFPSSYLIENGTEYMIGLINPYKLKSHVISENFKNSIPKYPEKKKELEKLANGLKETDNPVLVLVKLKE